MSDLHCTDGELLAILDGAPADERPATHARACPSCAARLDELRDDAVLFAEAASAVRPFGPPRYDEDFLVRVHGSSEPGLVDLGRERERRSGARPSGSSPRRWRRALAAAAVAGLLLTPPVRAWVTDTVAPLLGLGPERTAPVDVEPLVPSEVAARFAGPTLRLTFDAPPQRIDVAVREGGDGAVRAALSGTAPEAEILVGAEGFSFHGASTGVVELELHTGIRSLEIVEGGIVRWAGAVSDLPAEAWRVPWPGG